MRSRSLEPGLISHIHFYIMRKEEMQQEAQWKEGKQRRQCDVQGTVLLGNLGSFYAYLLCFLKYCCRTGTPLHGSVIHSLMDVSTFNRIMHSNSYSQVI